MRHSTLKYFLFISLLFIGSLYVHGQTDPQIMWQKTIGGSGDDFMYPNYPTADGGFIVGGISNSGIGGEKSESTYGGTDYWIVKLDARRNIMWQKTIGGSGNDNLYDIKATNDGGYILGGYSNSGISGLKTEGSFGADDVWIVKIDSIGNIEWQKTIGGSAVDWLATIAVTTDGGYFLGAYSTSSISGLKTENAVGGYDYWAIKIDSIGNIQWQNTIGGTLDDEVDRVLQTFDGGYLVAGSSWSNISGDKSENSYGSVDDWFVKLDTAGNIVWQKTIGGSGREYPPVIKQTADSGFVYGVSSYSGASGLKTDFNRGIVDYWVVKLDKTANIEWQKTFGGSQEDLFTSVDITTDGGYIICGNSKSNISFEKAENAKGNYDFWVLKLSRYGNIEWQNTIGGSGIDAPFLVSQCSDNNYLVGGYSYSGISGDKTDNTRGGADYWLVKILDPKRFVKGTVFADINTNCSLDTTIDLGFPNRIIHDEISGTNALSAADGRYNFPLYTDTALLYITNLETEDFVTCIPRDTIPIYIDSTSSLDTVGVNFPVQTSTFCHHLHINIGSSVLRGCNIFDASHDKYNVFYHNTGFDTARNAYVKIIIDTAIIDLVNSLSAYTQLADTLTFPLGDIPPFFSSSFEFNVHVRCDVLLGRTNCVKAFIFPHNNCSLPAPAYDSSDIRVNSYCESDTLHAKIENISNGHDMITKGFVSFYENEYILRVDTFLLAAGDSMKYIYGMNPGKTLTMVVHQHPNHPLQPIIIEHEMCGIAVPIITDSVVVDLPSYDDAAEYEETCMPIVGSHDPNLKSVSPQGLSAQHFTNKEQTLEYRIDFQNTGTDTAFKVVVIDTLSSWLDINTFEPLVYSHACTPQMEGKSTLKFIFNPIALPDSNASEPNSHGYVTFKIKPKINTPKGTIINNLVDIYFDQNEAVRTNTVFNRIDDTVFINLRTAIVDPKMLQENMLVFPNPTRGVITIKFDQAPLHAKLMLTDMMGNTVIEQSKINTNVLQLNADGLMKGTYLINIYEENILIGRSKIIIQ